MFPFKYPYTNFHEINLDWILETVKSNTNRIAANELKIQLIGGDDPLNSLHPVGSIFISAENRSPAGMFGGTWEQLKDRFLLGAGDIYGAGGTGGEATHTLTASEMPSHNHTVFGGSEVTTINTNSLAMSGAKLTDYRLTGTEGGDQPHNNMPPFISVYMWKRVS